MTQPPDRDDPEPEPAPAPGAPAEDFDSFVGMASPGALLGASVAGPAAASPPPALAAERHGFARPRAKGPDAMSDPAFRPALAAYVLLIGIVVTFGAAMPLVLYLAWTNKADAEPWLHAHYVYLLRTVWITGAAGLAGLITVPVGLGVFVLTLTAVWCVVRGAAGLPRLLKGRPIDDPRTWTLPWN